MLRSMKDPRTIVLGVDLLPSGELTQGCRTAADVVRMLVERTKAHVVLVHSTDPDEYWSPLERGLVIVSEGTSDAGRAAIDAVAAELRAAGAETEVVLDRERPYLAITRQAKAKDADLVVVGKHNQYENDARKLGNVARRILHFCPCPVLVVNAQKVTAPTSVLAATDLRDVGTKAVHTAAWIAAKYDVPLHVVHAYLFSLEHQIDPTGEREGGYDAMHEELRAAARAEIERELADTPCAGRAEVHVGFGAPGTVVLEAVEELKPGLVVLGTVSRGGIAGLLTGNTAERLLDRIPASILAVKPDDFRSPVEG